MDLFAPQSEEVVKQSLVNAKKQAQKAQADVFELAIDYLEGRQIEDVRDQLTQRYRRTQVGGSMSAGQEIKPLAVPLTQRFVDEAANAYNKPVKRELQHLDGTTDESTKKATESLNRELGESCHDEAMHQAERYSVLLSTCGTVIQAKRGQLRTVVVEPHLIMPVAPANGFNVDPSDQRDYLGFAYSVHYSSEQINSANRKTYCLLTPAEHIYYEGNSICELTKEIERFDNPFTWPQMEDTEDYKGNLVQDAGLQMMLLWHARKPVGCLIPGVDPEIVYANRELNVQWSALFDIARRQGFGQMFLKLVDASAPPPSMSYGASFAIPLSPGDDAQYVSASNDYTGMVNMLQSFVKLLAISKSMSANDFSLEAKAAESGFAKLVDSLPKIEARQGRVRRLKAMEEQMLWPRLGSVLRYLGKIDGDPTQLKMVSTFSDVEMQMSVQEQVAKDTFEFANGLSSPAEVLAKRTGVTLEQAQKTIDERKARQPQMETPPAARLGSRIGQPGQPRKQPNQAEGDAPDARTNARPSPFRDRQR